MNLPTRIASVANRVPRRRRTNLDLASLVQARSEVDNPRTQFVAVDRL